MATKCIVIGEVFEVMSPVKIELIKYLKENGCFTQEKLDNSAVPDHYTHIELITKKYVNDHLDLMLAYRDNRNSMGATLYLGHWNDGIV